MIKKTKTKTFDTETATLVEKSTTGVYGVPEGYEQSMYLSPEGDYFLYTNGGNTSAYPKEKITYYSKARAKDWLNKH